MLKKRYLDCELEVGCDEVGRGCLAGSVVACAVILPKDFYSDLIIDSKKLSEKKRFEAEKLIKEVAIDFSIQEVFPNEIDEINILNASILAMHKCVDSLNIIPEHILVDGNKFKPYKKIPHTCMIKGDSKYLSIAAASILAKNYRDDLMYQLGESNPEYNWKKNKGYPTAEHRKAIQEFGISKYHRKSFKLLANSDKK